jgi:hypothetical protein
VWGLTNKRSLTGKAIQLLVILPVDHGGGIGFFIIANIRIDGEIII